MFLKLQNYEVLDAFAYSRCRIGDFPVMQRHGARSVSDAYSPQGSVIVYTPQKSLSHRQARNYHCRRVSSGHAGGDVISCGVLHVSAILL